MVLTSWLTGRWVETFELANDDMVVFVVGPSGAGKSLVRSSSSYYDRPFIPSQFVQELTKSNLVKVSANLRPCSARVQAIRCKLTDEARTALLAVTQKNIVFVDTPSFLTGQNDGAAEKEMNHWLRKSKYDFLCVFNVTKTKSVCSDPSPFVPGPFTCIELKQTLITHLLLFRTI
ncbi:hypothetical protein OG21DRAFT_1247506 [Imleria badia]|nr:hypothetical protein OG21DRAFT_1247506 [Imleria badia]